MIHTLKGIDSWVEFVAGDLQVMNTKECVYQDIFSIGDDTNQFGEDSNEFYEGYDEYEVVEEDFYQNEYDEEGAYEEVSDSPQEI